MSDGEKNIEKFLMELFDDDIEKKIVKYISQNKTQDEIIDLLLKDMEVRK